MHFKTYLDKHVSAVYRCYEDVINNRLDYQDIYEYLEELSALLSEAYLQEELAAYAEITNWLPGFSGKSRTDVFDQNFIRDDMRLTIARSHGFVDWDDVDAQGDLEFEEHFENAVDCIQSGDIDSLKKTLEKRPSIIEEMSPFGHEATLLHYCATNGVETYHQKLPLNMPDMAAVLIEHGASKTAVAKCYGGEFNPFQLASTSGHPVAAGISARLIEVLTP